MTADFKKVYWLDVDEMTLFAGYSDEDSSSIEQFTTRRTSHLKKVMAFGSHLQMFPGILRIL